MAYKPVSYTHLDVYKRQYKKILDKLREFEQENTQIDMLLANYVYEKEGAKRKKVMRQTGFPRNEIFTWSDIKHIHKGHYILMHSVIYRTCLLYTSAAEYPDIVKAVHQENGGHGEAVNTGLKNATGKYFKVVDSDDWAVSYTHLMLRCLSLQVVLTRRATSSSHS